MKNNAKSYFAEMNRRFGFSANDSTFNSESHKGRPLLFSSDPVASDIRPHLVSVSTIDELKKLIGESDATDDSQIDYPVAYKGHLDRSLQVATTKTDFARSIDRKSKKQIAQAAYAYVCGNSEKVEDYEPLINALMFPTTVAYFAAAGNIVIDTETVIKGPGPVVLNYENITFKPGGSMTVETEFTLSCDSMTKES